MSDVYGHSFSLPTDEHDRAPLVGVGPAEQKVLWFDVTERYVIGVSRC